MRELFDKFSIFAYARSDQLFKEAQELKKQGRWREAAELVTKIAGINELMRDFYQHQINLGGNNESQKDIRNNSDIN